MYDAIVIGARRAGGATAMLLARGASDVLFVDRAELPSDIRTVTSWIDTRPPAWRNGDCSSASWRRTAPR
jgi:flavin-dependent dehydrogenase